jgi:hypothetical protein
MIEVNVDPYSSIIVVDSDGELLTVSEGDNIEFIIESTGELKLGSVVKFNSKKEKLKIQIIPTGENYEEIWPIVAIKEGSLKLVEETDDKNDNENLD